MLSVYAKTCALASPLLNATCKETQGIHSSINSSQCHQLPLTCHQLQPYTTCRMVPQSKFVTSHVTRNRLTHFLAIPLVTPTSRSQVLDSFKCLRDDLTAIGVPSDAVRSPGLLHLTLDILLRLDTPERMAKARKILSEVSITEALSTIHESSTPDNILRHSSMPLPTSNDDINSSMAPLRVSISGLFCTSGREARTRSLSTISYNATHRIRDLRLRLAHSYQAAGLSPEPRRPGDTQARAATTEILGSYDATVCLVNDYDSSKVIPSKRIPGKLKSLSSPPFDARSLLERYKDHVWMENVPLDRVSICKLGLRKVETGELPEVFSVPLS